MDIRDDLFIQKRAKMRANNFYFLRHRLSKNLTTVTVTTAPFGEMLTMTLRCFHNESEVETHCSTS